MKLGVPKESAPGERRVAMVPDVAKRLAAKGVEVVVEEGAGQGARIPDQPTTKTARGENKMADALWPEFVNR